MYLFTASTDTPSISAISFWVLPASRSRITSAALVVGAIPLLHRILQTLASLIVSIRAILLTGSLLSYSSSTRFSILSIVYTKSSIAQSKA